MCLSTQHTDAPNDPNAATNVGNESGQHQDIPRDRTREFEAVLPADTKNNPAAAELAEREKKERRQQAIVPGQFIQSYVSYIL